MAILHADIWVECDECGHTEAFEGIHCSGENLSQTSLHRYMTSEDWQVEGPDRHLCPNCVDLLEDDEDLLEDDEDEDEDLEEEGEV